MAILPRPVSPRSAFADLRLMFSADRPHRWTFLGLSCALTGIILWGFVLDSRIPPKEREIFYVESWMNDRKDSDIIRQQKIDLANYEAALASKQKEFQNLADMVGIEWRKEEAENRARREAVIVAMQKLLDQRLEEALAREAAGGKAAGSAANGIAPTKAASGNLAEAKLSTEDARAQTP